MSSAAARSPVSPAQVLCVDDDPMLRALFVRVLSQEFHVVTAENGAIGLERLAQSGPFAVVIADLAMPGMSGSTFLSEVRHRAPDVVRVMLTGCATVGAAEAVKTGQVFRFINKPCAPRELLQVVRDSVDHHQILSRKTA